MFKLNNNENVSKSEFQVSKECDIFKQFDFTAFFALCLRSVKDTKENCSFIVCERNSPSHSFQSIFLGEIVSFIVSDLYTESNSCCSIKIMTLIMFNKGFLSLSSSLHPSLLLLFLLYLRTLNKTFYSKVL